MKPEEVPQTSWCDWNRQLYCTFRVLLRYLYVTSIFLCLFCSCTLISLPRSNNARIYWTSFFTEENLPLPIHLSCPSFTIYSLRSELLLLPSSHNICKDVVNETMAPDACLNASVVFRCIKSGFEKIFTSRTSSVPYSFLLTAHIFSLSATWSASSIILKMDEIMSSRIH